MKLESTLSFRPGVMVLIPLADVFLTLLVFFLLGSSLVLQSGVRLELPPSSFAVQGLADAHVLVVSAGPAPRLILNQVEIAPAQLAARLDELAKADIDHNGRVGGLILKADRSTPHGLVSELTSAALSRGFRVAWATLPVEGD